MKWTKKIDPARREVYTHGDHRFGRYEASWWSEDGEACIERRKFSRAKTRYIVFVRTNARAFPDGFGICTSMAVGLSGVGEYSLADAKKRALELLADPGRQRRVSQEHERKATTSRPPPPLQAP